MSDRGAEGFKDYSEVRSETRIDIWEPLIFGLVFKATGVEEITWEKICIEKKGSILIRWGERG